MKKILVFFTLLGVQPSHSQDLPAAYTRLAAEAKSFYKAGNWLASAQAYSEAFKSIGWKGTADDRYMAARAWTKCRRPDSAFFNLERIAARSGYSNDQKLLADSSLTALHGDARWPMLITLVRQNREKAEALLDKPLMAALDSIYNNDQQPRLELRRLEKLFGHNSAEVKAQWAQIRQKDSANQVRISGVLDSRGWLGPEVIGEQGNSTLFLVVQHAGQAMQEKYLPIMREAVKKGRAAAPSLALLEDRVALGQGKRQLYGSQVSHRPDGTPFLLPLEDPDHVDERRRSVGLQPLATYLRHWNIAWNVEQYKTELAAEEAKQKKTTRNE